MAEAGTPTAEASTRRRTGPSLCAVRLVVARCTVDYQGRLAAHLPEALRLVMVKADGCVAVHGDGGAYKPLNWMNAPNRLQAEQAEPAEPAAPTEQADDTRGGWTGTWTVTNPKGETLTIVFCEVLSDVSFEMGADPGLQKDGVEAHLQALLAENPAAIADGLRLMRREYPTDIGPVDLMCRDADGNAVAIEVKRRGEIDGVEQLSRYLDFLNSDPRLRPVRGVLVAQEVKPQARVLARSRSIDWVEVDCDELRGLAPANPRLF